MDHDILTSQQAYQAMFLFLTKYYQRFSSNPPAEIAILLSFMQLLDDNTSADPAYKADWQQCVEAVLREEQ